MPRAPAAVVKNTRNAVGDKRRVICTPCVIHPADVISPSGVIYRIHHSKLREANDSK
jgi:hypothetical protein